MITLKRYSEFIDSFENNNIFNNIINSYNTLFNSDEQLFLNIKKDYNIKNIFKDKKYTNEKSMFLNFFISIKEENHYKYNDVVAEKNHNLFFIIYKNDNDIYLNDLLIKKEIKGNINTIRNYIEDRLEIYHYIFINENSYNFKNSFTYYYNINIENLNILDNIHNFVTFILKNNDKTAILDKDRFLEKLRNKKVSKNIYMSYKYLVDASNFDLI